MGSRREFLKQTAGALAVPFLSAPEYLSGSIRISDEFGDLEKELILDSLRYVGSRYDIHDLKVDFINGRHLGREYYGAAYYDLGNITRIKNPEIDGFFSRRAVKSKNDFITLFGEEAYQRFQGKSIVALKDIETLQKDYPSGSFSICSRYIPRNSPELWYRLVTIHEFGHILLLYKDLVKAYQTLKQIRQTNRVLAERYSDPENYLLAGVSNRHPGHVDCYTFNRFFKLQNSMKSANEDFVQILAFHILSLPMSRRDEILAKKAKLVNNFMEEHYGKNQSTFRFSDH